MDTIAALCEAARARCEARASAMRERGPLVLVLDSLPAAPACEVETRQISALAKRSSGGGIHVGARFTARRNAGKSRRVDWSAECMRQTRRYGVVSLDGGESPDGVSYMLRQVEAGLYEHDEGSEDPYGGHNRFNLLDYGWLADTCGLRACAGDCSPQHYYALGHALYRRALKCWGGADGRTRRLERFAAPDPDSGGLMRAWSKRASGGGTRGAVDRAMARAARVHGPALGSV